MQNSGKIVESTSLAPIYIKKKTSFSQKNNAKSDIILAITFNEIKKLRYNGQTHMFKAFSLNKNF